jgi:hypothetical protein
MINNIKAIKTEGYLLGAILAWALAVGAFSGSLWVLNTESVTGRVASLSSYPKVMSALWMVLAAAMLPYYIMQILQIFVKWREPITRLCCRATTVSGVIWVYLGYLSYPLDYMYVTTIFVVNGLTCISMAATLANSLNNAKIEQEAAE